MWAALGDVPHYCEPFAGSLAVLLRRPHQPNRPYYSETVADTDSMLCNFWRAVQLRPQETAEAASWPPDELTKHARGCFLLKWRESEATAHLAGDPFWCDPLVAGWWVWCVCCSIGAWGQGGPWWPDEEGRLRKRPRGKNGGVKGDLLHMGDNGKGVNHPQTREPGVKGNLPHLSNDGQGVNRPQAREPGVWADRPHLSDDGQGVNRPQTREPGVSADLPHLGDDGKGVTRPQAREPGVSADLPHLGSDGGGVNHAGTREPGLSVEEYVRRDYEATEGYHPMTMPEIRRWFAWLSARLRHVRIINGDWTGAVNGGWQRLLTSGASLTLPVRQGKGPCGVFLDPPYGVDDRDSLYGVNESFEVAAKVREWCLKHGDDTRYRIVYAGFDLEGTDLVAAGWREVEWFREGHLKGGLGNTAKRDEDDDTPRHQQQRERLWLSPHCLVEAAEPQKLLF